MMSVAFVGCGPTAIYTLHALVRAAHQPFALTLFEAQSTLGLGTPYRPGWNDPSMLSNIASIELPPLTETLVEWLSRQSDGTLEELDVDRAQIGDRTFYPRLVLGEYFRSQADSILAVARAREITVDVRLRSRVLDARSLPDGMILSVRPRGGAPYEARFDHVVLATGHQWPEHPEVRPGYFVSPWPASVLKTVPACEVGIRGTSLTAIDATVALALAHGDFVKAPKVGLDYRPAPGSDGFRITMLSRKGLLPEADFYAPLPYEPLSICTAEAIEKLIASDPPDLLNEAFALFKRELMAADPPYAEKLDLGDATLEEFHDRYFAERAANDPFVWAEQNLREARSNYRKKIVVRWRYAILRMHEVVELLVPHLEGKDYQRFNNFFKPIFVDDYATVPHKSITRLLALHRAGKLDVLALGARYKVDTYRAEGGVEVAFDGQKRRFPVFVEAMGQKALPAREFPFASLVRQGIIHDVAAEGSKAGRGIAIDDRFHPLSAEMPVGQLFCLSLPFILGRHPFHQGITSSHEMGESVGRELAALLDAGEIEPRAPLELTLAT
ncbi:FAD-NAD(P)-binding protein [soil metagenome]